jgi:predicted RNA-binding Zn-ribbon protein involved in translation (DUF1610 family)
MSLLLCLACVVALGVGGTARFVSYRDTRAFMVGVDNESLFVGWRLFVYRPPWAGQVSRFGFRYTRWSDNSAELSLPLWLPAAAFAVTGLGAGTLAFRHRRSKAPGLCIHCGYDLRATPEKCPECGTVNRSHVARVAAR